MLLYICVKNMRKQLRHCGKTIDMKLDINGLTQYPLIYINLL